MAYPLEIVHWRDPSSRVGWHPVEGLSPELADCQTVGWVLQEDDDTLLMAASLNNGGDCGEPTTIAKSLVYRRRRLITQEVAST